MRIEQMSRLLPGEVGTVSCIFDREVQAAGLTADSAEDTVQERSAMPVRVRQEAMPVRRLPRCVDLFRFFRSLQLRSFYALLNLFLWKRNFFIGSCSYWARVQNKLCHLTPAPSSVTAFVYSQVQHSKVMFVWKGGRLLGSDPHRARVTPSSGQRQDLQPNWYDFRRSCWRRCLLCFKSDDKSRRKKPSRKLGTSDVSRTT